MEAGRTRCWWSGNALSWDTHLTNLIGRNSKTAHSRGGNTGRDHSNKVNWVAGSIFIA